MSDDLRQRYAEALAAAGWLPRRDHDVKAVLDALMVAQDDELGRLRSIITDYDNTISWNTTCREHARLLHECRRQEERAEQAEAANARTRERLDALIAAGFGAVGDTFRELRATLDGQEPDRGGS